MRLLDNVKVVIGTSALDINGAGAAGDYASFKNYDRALVIVNVGAIGGNAALTLKQASAVAGTGEKALGFTKIWVSDADGDTFTETAVTSDSYTLLGTGGDNKTYLIEVLAEDLDMDNGFDCFRTNIADPSAATVVGVNYVMYNARFTAGGAGGPTAITD